MTINSTHTLEILVNDKTGTGISGLSVNYEIRKSSDNSLFDSGTLNDVGSGIYTKDIIFSQLGQFRIIYQTPIKYTDEIETVEVENESTTSSDVWEELLSDHSTAGTFGLALRQILGLSQKNFRLFDITYDGNGQIESTIVRIYKNATDTENDVDPILSSKMVSEYNVNGDLISCKAKEI